MDYYSATRKEETLLFGTTCIYHESITLREMSGGKGQEPYSFTHVWDLKQKVTNEQTNS